MKKIFTILSVAVMAAACAKEPVPAEQGATGYLKLNVSADNSVAVKSAVSVDDLSGWTIKVGETAYTGEAQAFVAGDYTVKTYNYVDDAAAAAANSKWGAARYEGSTDVTVVAGKTATASIACGTAKNARFKVVFADSFKDICFTSEGVADDTYALTTDDERALVFDKTTTDKLAYYAAGAQVGYKLDYVFKGVAKSIDGSFTLGGAATQKSLTVSANTNGTIRVTVSYDDTFTDAEGEEITFDAAAGTVVAEE